MDNNAVPAVGSGDMAGNNRGGISGSTLKLIAIVTMLIDHIGAVVIEKMITVNGVAHMTDNITLYVTYIMMRTIGRLAFPIFCFLLVEGFLHTRSVTKYAIRLAIFALISEVPFDLALFGKINFGYQNVFFTLLIGLLVLIGFKTVKEKASDKKWLPALAVISIFIMGYALTEAVYNFIDNYNGFFNSASGKTLALSGLIKLVNIAAFSCVALAIYLLMSWRSSIMKVSIWFTDLGIIFAGMLLAYALVTDYSGFGVLTIAAMYGLRKKPFRSMLGGCITLAIMSTSEIPAFIDLLLILFYNGRRGLKLKYIFYAFYPVHLFILYLICYFAKLV